MAAQSSTAGAAVGKKKIGFMSLARELRDLIYQESDSVIRILEKDSEFSREAIVELHGTPSLNLKLVSHQVNVEYHEALLRTAKPPCLVLPLAVYDKLAGVEQVDVEYHRCSNGGDIKASVRKLPSLQTLRCIHHRDHAGQLTIVNGLPKLRFLADDEALQAIQPGYIPDKSTNPPTYRPHTIENVLVVHDKLFSMWNKAANLTFLERSRYENHLRNSMTYTIKSIGTLFTAQETAIYRPQFRQYVDVELEAAPAFAGSFEEVEAEMVKK